MKAAELVRTGAWLTWAEAEEKSDLICPELCHGRAHFSFCTRQASTGIGVMPPMETSCRQGLDGQTV